MRPDLPDAIRDALHADELGAADLSRPTLRSVRRRGPRLRWALSVVAVVVVATAVAVGGAYLHSPGRQPGMAPSATGASFAAATAANRQRAHQEVARLLDLIRLPAGATRLANPPPASTGVARGIALTYGKTTIDGHRAWRVPASAATTFAWLTARPPTDPNLAASTSKDSTAARSIWFEEAHPPAGLRIAQVQLSVAPLGASAALVRADAYAAWIDENPATDSAAGPRLRITVAGGCPRTDAGAVGVTSPGPGLATALLPPGTPTAALVCRYVGVDGPTDTPPFALRSQARLDLAAAARLAAAVRTVTFGHLDDAMNPGGLNASEAAVAIAISYSGRPDVDLWYRSTASPYLANGHIVSGDSLGSFPATLASLAPQS